MGRKPLNDFFGHLNKPVLAWAKEKGVMSIVPGIYRHLSWEKNKGGKGRPLGQTQAIRLIKAADGLLTMDDLRPDKAAEIASLTSAVSPVARAAAPAHPAPDEASSP
jgi:hypothetical protein